MGIGCSSSNGHCYLTRQYCVVHINADAFGITHLQ